ncbi:16S rRNA (guanine(966)-N(2))-methyltransferase RsmD [Glycomyces buryatensis]|uniref:16S rRNA (Guanine(966)-N(2))-methyltransferase RsmD n=1 Tax=Glycomyces buryatensis TaxID=2570927 RepID=A0A4S8QEY6_9ACTN|nr:16S rRNA (guanine(966)-N(2))-methyltransferase RsmD [Glycomyces buryatensis]THV42920.1 16S rRNA (guanine(966)-N(2))-methyltransferase RsmD [Glycomyces buryatensis]
MTRIIAGALKGRRLATPSGDRTRPTSDRVREALFNSLAPGGDLQGLRFADLYAGSGAVGLEAISRGAEHALFVESHALTAKLLRRNIAELDVDNADVICAPVEKALATPPDEPYDIVFADPPYAVTDAAVAAFLEALVEHGWLAPDADLVVERAGRDASVPWPPKIAEDRVRRYGTTALCYGHRL